MSYKLSFVFQHIHIYHKLGSAKEVYMEERQNNERPIEDYQKAKDKIFKLVNTYRTHLYISHQDLFGTEIGGSLYDHFAYSDRSERRFLSASEQ